MSCFDVGGMVLEKSCDDSGSLKTRRDPLEKSGRERQESRGSRAYEITTDSSVGLCENPRWKKSATRLSFPTTTRSELLRGVANFEKEKIK